MKYCPNPECPHLLSTGYAPEYIDGIPNCANCETELLDGEAPVLVDDQKEIVLDSPLVIIATYNDVFSAQFSKSILESAGIPVFLRDEHIVSIQSLYSFAVGGVKLVVPESLAETAIELIRGAQPGSQLSPEQDHSELEEVEIEEHCPRCKSDKTVLVNPYLKSGFLSLLIGIPLRLRGKKYKCCTCGCRWK